MTLTGVKSDIDVRCVSLGDDKYKCSYIPQLVGAYLLNIMWSDRQVKGSPFKVNVITTGDASKVVAVGKCIKWCVKMHTKFDQCYYDVVCVKGCCCSAMVGLRVIKWCAKMNTTFRSIFTRRGMRQRSSLSGWIKWY